MKEVKVKIQDADSPVTGYQCAECGYFYFEEKTKTKAIDEVKLKEAMMIVSKMRGKSPRQTTDEEIHRIREQVAREFEKKFK